MSRPIASLALLLALAAAPLHAQHSMDAGAPAGPPPLYKDLGTWSHTITTSSPRAQQYFDQGLRLCYGFNHDEATRAFREAARLDPNCAMAWWGVAYAAGPNINLPMDEQHSAIANQAIARAVALKGKAGAADRDYIDALAKRYSLDPGRTRGALDSAYAGAMQALAARYPNDPDAAALSCEARMDLNPWNQWAHDGSPNPGTLELVAELEAIMKRWPKHPGANHFYIHAIEASPNPDRGLDAAARLESLVPGAGHLVHMPAHIYARTGRYDDAVKRNQIAAAVDEKYIAEQKPTGFYPLMYYNHNLQFIWFCSMMEGRSAESLAAGRKMMRNVNDELIAQIPMLEMIPPYPLLTLLRFGRWQEVLQEPAPPESQKYAHGIWSYTQGVAQAATGDFAAARASLVQVQAASQAVPADMMISINYAAPLLRIATHALAGEIAVRERTYDDAVRSFRTAIAVEDSLHYDEPPTWYCPLRQALGSTLLNASRPADAEREFREDLRRHPENGWSLRGLMLAQRAQNKLKDADATEARFKQAWARADVTLVGNGY